MATTSLRGAHLSFQQDRLWSLAGEIAMNQDNERILYLTRKEVEQLCSGLDSVAIMEEVFLLYSQQKALLPNESYLGWTNEHGEFVRNLNMPGFVGGAINCAGTKIINANVCNPQRGYPRASGLTLLHDTITARTFCIMEGAYLSSLRTASVSLLAAEKLRGPAIECVAVIGAGVQAHAHIRLLLQRSSQYYAALRRIVVYDLSPERIMLLQELLQAHLQQHGVEFVEAGSAEEAVRQGQLIIPVTTTTEGYICYDWLQPGTILIHVSLDDVLPEVVLNAESVIVDDWSLVKDDPRRLLGRMYRAGQIVGPSDELPMGGGVCRRIDAELGQIVAGEKRGRRHGNDIVLVNPFGLAIEDVALASFVYQRARAQNLGQWLER